MIRRFTLILSCSASIFMCACTTKDPGPVEEKTDGIIPSGSGLFILNEGNFSAGNGSLSFYSYDSSKIYNNIYSAANNRPLGDVPNSMIISSDKAYIVVNNSGKIEIIDKNTVSSLGTISGLVSPRNILLTDSLRAYVSSLYSTKITILDLATNSVSGNIELRRSSEAMLKKGDKVYISCWSTGHEIMIVNSKTDHVVDSIEVGHEPESMVLDKNSNLWVLCTGGYSGEYSAELDMINTTNDEVDRKLIFPSETSYPSSLQLNKAGDTIYYIDTEIWKMSVGSVSLPDQPFIRSAGRLYYKMGIDPVRGEVFATNAVDYQQQGYLLRFSTNGSLIDSVKTDIIPGSLCFKQN